MTPEETRLREALVWAWTGVNVGVVMVSTDDLTALLSEMERLRATLRLVNQMLTIPAAEYVPTIREVWTVIEAALAQEGEG